MTRVTIVFSMAVFLVIGGSVGLAQNKKDNESKFVKQISLKGISLGIGKFGGSALKPTVIKSQEDLAKAIPDKKAQGKILDQVNLKNQILLYFKWSGSGQDKIDYKVNMGQGKPVVLFNYRRGLTRDLRQHRKLYAVQQNVDWMVKAAKIKFKK